MSLPKKSKTRNQSALMMSLAHLDVPRNSSTSSLLPPLGQKGLTEPDGHLWQLKAALVSRAPVAEMRHHLGSVPGNEPPPEQPNRRNGKRSKILGTDRGEVELEVPSNREGSFEPKLEEPREWQRRPLERMYPID